MQHCGQSINPNTANPSHQVALPFPQRTYSQRATRTYEKTTSKYCTARHRYQQHRLHRNYTRAKGEITGTSFRKPYLSGAVHYRLNVPRSPGKHQTTTANTTPNPPCVTCQIRHGRHRVFLPRKFWHHGSPRRHGAVRQAHAKPGQEEIDEVWHSIVSHFSLLSQSRSALPLGCGVLARCL